MANKNVAYITFGAQPITDRQNFNTEPVTYEVVITNYTRGYNSQLNTATVRKQKHSYPIRVKEQDFQFSIQCRNLEEYETLKKEVRRSHLNALTDVYRGACRVLFPSAKIDYLGYFNQSPEGTRRFEFAPVLSLTMLLLKDTINTIASQYSTASGTWQGIYGTNIADLYGTNKQATVDYGDHIAASNAPTQGNSFNTGEHDGSSIQPNTGGSNFGGGGGGF